MCVLFSMSLYNISHVIMDENSTIHLFEFFLTHMAFLSVFLTLIPLKKNGKVERIIHTLNNMVRNLLFQAHLLVHYWVEALYMNVHLLNILPTKALNNITPYEALHYQVPSYNPLYIFRCLCYPNLSSTPPHKSAPRSMPCVFLSFPSNHKGYCYLDLCTYKIINLTPCDIR